MAQTSPIPVAGLGLDELRTAYEAGSTTPSALVSALYPHWVAASGVFIHLQPLEVLLQRTVALEAIPPSSRGPLHGIPFATKDNVDVAGTPTTAACPAFKYTPSISAPAVQALEDAGVLLIVQVPVGTHPTLATLNTSHYTTVLRCAALRPQAPSTWGRPTWTNLLVASSAHARPMASHLMLLTTGATPAACLQTHSPVVLCCAACLPPRPVTCRSLP